MRYGSSLILAMVFSFLIACGGDDNRDEQVEEKASGVITQAIEAQKDALERAKQVEQQLKDAAEKQRQEIERQTDGDSDSD